MGDAAVDVLAALGLDDLDRLNDGVGIEGEVLFLLRLCGGSRCSSGVFLGLRSLGLGGFRSRFSSSRGSGSGRGGGFGLRSFCLVGIRHDLRSF
jgi:hypothetical protein